MYLLNTYICENLLFMKKLILIPILCFFLFSCSSDEDNNPYCWEITYINEEPKSCYNGIEFLEEICDKTEKEIKLHVNELNEYHKSIYESGETDECLKVFSYKKSVK